MYANMYKNVIPYPPKYKHTCECALPERSLTPRLPLTSLLLTAGQNSGTTVKRGKSYCHISDFISYVCVWKYLI